MVQSKSRTILPIALIIAVFYAIIFLHSSGRSITPSFVRNHGDADQTTDSATSTDQVNLATEKHEFAITTFLTGQAKDDSYFIATRTLAYQLLHAPSTKIRNSSIAFVVLCSESLESDKRDQLRKDGAIVAEVKDVALGSWVKVQVDRWKEQFTKLRVFQMTQYKRVLYIDADTLITKPMDDIFAEPEVKTLAPTLLHRKDQIKDDESELPKEWFFAARSDNAFLGERDHPVPPLQTNVLTAGFFMAAPDQKLFDHFLSVIKHEGRFDSWSMEQSMFNYVFRRDGAMPWRELNWRWSATWPSEKDLEMGVHSLHEKFWVTGPQKLVDMWKARKDEMLKFYGES